MITSDEKVRNLVRAADDKQARNLVVLDLRGRTLMTDFLLLCSGTSQVHIRTIADHLVETMKRSGAPGIRLEGYDAARWVLMDYQDVIAHVMAADERDYYNLEGIWADAPRIPIEAGELATQTAADSV